MSIAFKVDNNIVTQVIEIPEEESKNLKSFIKDILKLDGEWFGDFDVKNNNIPQQGDQYIKQSGYIVNETPYESWSLNDRMEWEAPENDVFRHSAYRVTDRLQKVMAWDEERRKWKDDNVVELIESENAGAKGIFMIHKSINSNKFSSINEIYPGRIITQCNPSVLGYFFAHPLYDGDNFIGPLMNPNGIGKQYGVKCGSKSSAMGIQVVYDATPVFGVCYIELRDASSDPDNIRDSLIDSDVSTHCEEFQNDFLNLHPHVAGRSLGELLKIIIEWDQAYHYFNNEEPMAIFCHEILCALQVPKDIYNLINKEMPDYYVKKYINSNSEDLTLSDVSKTNPKVIEWLLDKYYDLRYLKTYELFNVDPDINTHYFSE